MDTKVLTARIPLPLAKKLDDLAKRLERSRGSLIEEALAVWVESEEERHRLTLEGLTDVDEGRVIDHRDVQAWADSLDTDHPLPVPR